MQTSSLSKHSKPATIFPLILNQGNLVANTTNQFRYSFPVGSVKFQDAKVAVQSISLYLSWINISAAFGNNTFQYTFTNNTTTTTYTVTVPDGYYSIDDLNLYLETVQITNGTYLVDASGDYVYYISVETNSTYYSIQFNMYAFPTALPTGYTNPAGVTFPATASTTQVIIQANAFADLVGITAGTYPTVIQATNYSKLSNYVPQVTPVQSEILTCNLLNNKLSVPNNILYTFSSGSTAFGSLINTSPNESYFVDIQNGHYSTIECTFLDQDLNALKIQDTNIIITLLISMGDGSTY